MIQAEKGTPTQKFKTIKCVLNLFLGKLQCFKSTENSTLRDKSDWSLWIEKWLTMLAVEVESKLSKSPLVWFWRGVFILQVL